MKNTPMTHEQQSAALSLLAYLLNEETPTPQSVLDAAQEMANLPGPFKRAEVAEISQKLLANGVKATQVVNEMATVSNGFRPLDPNYNPTLSQAIGHAHDYLKQFDSLSREEQGEILPFGFRSHLLRLLKIVDKPTLEVNANGDLAQPWDTPGEPKSFYKDWLNVLRFFDDKQGSVQLSEALAALSLAVLIVGRYSPLPVAIYKALSMMVPSNAIDAIERINGKTERHIQDGHNGELFFGIEQWSKMQALAMDLVDKYNGLRFNIVRSFYFAAQKGSVTQLENAFLITPGLIESLLNEGRLYQQEDGEITLISPIPSPSKEQLMEALQVVMAYPFVIQTGPNIWKSTGVVGATLDKVMPTHTEALNVSGVIDALKERGLITEDGFDRLRATKEGLDAISANDLDFVRKEEESTGVISEPKPEPPFTMIGNRPFMQRFHDSLIWLSSVEIYPHEGEAVKKQICEMLDVRARRVEKDDPAPSVDLSLENQATTLRTLANWSSVWRAAPGSLYDGHWLRPRGHACHPLSHTEGEALNKHDVLDFLVSQNRVEKAQSGNTFEWRITEKGRDWLKGYESTDDIKEEQPKPDEFLEFLEETTTPAIGEHIS